MKLKFAKPVKKVRGVKMSIKEKRKASSHARTRQVKCLKRLPSRSSLKRKCDILLSKIIRSRGSCEMCSRGGDRCQLQCAHVYTRANLHLRYDPMNVLCLCAKCHMWAHHNPIDFTHWFEGVYKARAEYLKVEKNVPETNIDYLKVLEALKGAPEDKL